MEGTEVQNASEYPVEKLKRLPKKSHQTTALLPCTWKCGQCSKLGKEHPANLSLVFRGQKKNTTLISVKIKKKIPVSSPKSSSEEKKKISVCTTNFGIEN